MEYIINVSPPHLIARATNTALNLFQPETRKHPVDLPDFGFALQGLDFSVWDVV